MWEMASAVNLSISLRLFWGRLAGGIGRAAFLCNQQGLRASYSEQAHALEMRTACPRLKGAALRNLAGLARVAVNFPASVTARSQFTGKLAMPKACRSSLCGSSDAPLAVQRARGGL